VQQEPEFRTLARYIDAERAEWLSKELGAGEEESAALLLGAAYPALTPTNDWQLEGLARLYREGFRIRRRTEESRVRLSEVMAAQASEEARLTALRRASWLEKARIALRELLPPALGGAPVEVTSHELSGLADAALAACLTEASVRTAQRYGQPLRANRQPSELCAFGMGKLGGHELNAGSDIDLIFFYDDDDGGSELSLHEHWSRVVRRTVSYIDTPSADGLLWRVDLRLRPEGSQGPIVNSVSAAERYYETWGRLWERSALLRARCSAGSRKLGLVIEREVISPFVYRKEVDPALASALGELLLRSRRELTEDAGRDLKLGVGGIREAEFFVQSLQLIWGGKQPVLRTRNTLQALTRLEGRGLVSDREAQEIASAYVLLRRLEHHVQWSSGLQTHLLPPPGAELDRAARCLRLRDSPTLIETLERARLAVHELFEALVPRSSTAAATARYAPLLSALDGTREELQRAAEQRYADADIAEHLAALARRPDGLLGSMTRERFPSLAERVLDALASSPDPCQAARYLRSFFGRFLSPAPYVAALAEDAPALNRLVTVLGSSAFVGEAVAARPDFADVVVFGAGAISEPRGAVQSEIDAQLAAIPADADQYERQQAFVTALRIAKRRVTVEVAAADLAGALGTRETTLLLSLLADEELERALAFVLGEEPHGLCVIAMGKLGGRDIGYGSDLDVIFIYDPAAAPRPEEAGVWFARVAQRVIRLVSEPGAAGPGYELDTRLRPSGSQGLLVSSLEAFARYHQVSLGDAEPPSVQPSGAPWERQALLRARVCAGDRALGERAISVARRAAYEGGAPDASEIRRLRERMERELGREREERLDLKSGRGGLLDVEFAVQWLQMRHGSDGRVRTTDTVVALEALSRAGYLERRRFEALREGYRFLRLLEQRIHVLRGAGSSVLEPGGRELRLLARRMGYRDLPSESAEQQLLTRYREVTSEVRGAFQAILGDAP
jgi:[glutamine synthetase] adenylyltransferase / [glutamine synthetase]-adenylyl-L-tyrosine phosphorylase